MVYTTEEYAERFKFGGRRVSSRTIERRIKANMLPLGHHARKLPGRTGAWVIEIDDSVINENIARNYSLQIKARPPV